MKRRHSLLLLLVAFCMTMLMLPSPAQRHTTAKQPDPSSPSPTTGVVQRSIGPVESEDTVVLSFVLKQRYGEWRRGFVVQKETLRLKDIKELLSFDMHRRRHPQKAERGAFDDFARRNKRAAVVPPLNIGKPLQVATQREINAAFKKAWWKGFYKKYPHTDGMLHLCLPGFSTDHHTALVYVSRHSGGRSGDGVLILLEKRESTWAIKETLTGWRS